MPTESFESATCTDEIDRYYEEYSIYRSMIVCDTEETAIQMIHDLQKKDYTVCSILDYDICDERPLYMNLLRGFHESMDRMLVITYWVLLQIPNILTSFVLPHQNLIIYYNLDSHMSRVVSEWLEDGQRTGFVDTLNILSV
jgi:hypothetical protein